MKFLFIDLVVARLTYNGSKCFDTLADDLLDMRNDFRYFIA